MSMCNKMIVAIDKQVSEILIFRTDLKTKGKVRTIEPILNTTSAIAHWSVDIADIDNVLRIVSNGKLDEKEVISLVKNSGFNCEALTY